MRRVAIVGGGIAGVTAAWQIARLAASGAAIEARLFEGSGRLGGIVETVRRAGFTIECGPDAWVSEKPWAGELARDLGLGAELIFSNDATRKTHILLDGRLETMPDGMRMMVPGDLDALDASRLFSASARRAYHDEVDRAAELRGSAPAQDESVAAFTRRHFGDEVLTRIAAPLLSGVFGGDVESLSVQAVMPQFVRMEREYGSLIAGLRAKAGRAALPIFTSLRGGVDGLISGMTAEIPAGWVRLNCPVTAIERVWGGWRVGTDGAGEKGGRRASAGELPTFDAVFVAVPPAIASRLVRGLDERAAELMQMDATSAIVVGLAYAEAQGLELPAGFGFLVPPSEQSKLLACTFVDQKFAHRAPPQGRLLRAFFGGKAAEGLLGGSDDQLATLAQEELGALLGPLPRPTYCVVRRWPRSLPQYAVGHPARMAELQARIEGLPGLTLLGNGYRGVGLPDLIRDSREAAWGFAEGRSPHAA